MAQRMNSGRHGWWTQDEKQRSKAANPIFPNEGQMHEVVKEEIEKVVVRHHVSRSNHQQAYATTLYAKKDKDTYVAREVFTTLTPKNLGKHLAERIRLLLRGGMETVCSKNLTLTLEGENLKTNQKACCRQVYCANFVFPISNNGGAE